MIFTNVVKPTHICNLNCSYCYNDDVRDPIMRPEVLERTIEQSFAYVRARHPSRLLSFIWHGGEPMVPGLSFYRQVVDLQRRHGDGVRYDNSLQTNGVLLDDRWFEFLLAEDFSLSISIDGPQALHDRYRVDHRGRGTFDRVVRAIDSAVESGVPVGVCVVISRANIDHMDEIYDFVASRRLPFNIIPLNRSGAARNHYDEVGLDAEEYGDAWIRMYDRWFDASGDDYVYCSDFVFKTRAIAAGRPADCIGLEHCSETNIAVDPVGDVFPCATLSGSRDTLYGNLVNQDLEELMDGPVAMDYRQRRTDPQCSQCRWQHVCHGGCLARSYKFFGEHHRRDYYCPSLFKIYEHIAVRLADQLGGKRMPPMKPPVSEGPVTPTEPLVQIGR